ncbi:hypothetical protein Dimus_022972, partial [Dionaea muscipula]
AIRWRFCLEGGFPCSLVVWPVVVKNLAMGKGRPRKGRSGKGLNVKGVEVATSSDRVVVGEDVSPDLVDGVVEVCAPGDGLGSPGGVGDGRGMNYTEASAPKLVENISASEGIRDSDIPYASAVKMGLDLQAGEVIFGGPRSMITNRDWKCGSQLSLWKPKSVTVSPLGPEMRSGVLCNLGQLGEGCGMDRNLKEFASTADHPEARNEAAVSGILAVPGVAADQGDWVVASKVVKRLEGVSPGRTTTHHRFAALEVPVDIVDNLCYRISDGYRALRGQRDRVPWCKMVVLGKLLQGVNLTLPKGDWRRWMVMVSKGKTDMAMARRKCFAAFVYGIWEERNARVFTGRTTVAEGVIERIRSFLVARVHD